MILGKKVCALVLVTVMWLSGFALQPESGGSPLLPSAGVTEPDSLSVTRADSIADAIRLDEVVVVAPIKPVTFRGDTTIIDPRAFKTGDGAYLEELVRLIPGMAYDKKNGTLTYNGQPINDININGKSFLKDGKTLALENLQADLFSKIKIYDKSSDTDRFMGVRSAGKNYVLDLSTKADYHGSLMMQTSVGAGSEEKKGAELSGNCFMAGGDGYSLRLESGNRRLTSRMKGNRDDTGYLSLSKTLCGDRLSLSFNSNFSNDRLGDESSSSFEQYLPAGNTYSYVQGSNRSRQFNWQSNMHFGWHIGKKTFISLKGDFVKGRNRNTVDSRNASFDSNPGLNVISPFDGEAYDSVEPTSRLNSVRNVSERRSDRKNYGFDVSVTHKFNTHGTALSLAVAMNNGDTESKALSESETRYYRLTAATGRDSVLYRNQYALTPSVSRTRSVGLRFVQPLWKEWKIELGASYRRSRESYRRSTYDLTPFFDSAGGNCGAGELPESYGNSYVDSLSNHSFNRVEAAKFEAKLMYFVQKWYFNLSFASEPERRTLDQKTGIRQADTVRRSVNFIPNLQMHYYGKTWRTSVSYSGATSQPQLSSLLSLTDNSNPLYITRGNPALKASYSQNFRADVQYNPLNLSCDASFSNSYNTVTQAVFYDPSTGGRLSYPVNINGERSAHTSLRYFSFIKGRWLVSCDVNGSYNRNVGLINEDMTENPRRSITRSRSVGTRGGLNLIAPKGGFHFMADWSFQRSANDFRAGDIISRNYSLSFSPNLDLPCGLYLSTEVDYNISTGTDINPRDFRQCVWNMEVKWRFLRQRVAEVAFVWADILSDRKSYSRSVTASGIHESYNRQIGSYFFVSFSYRFNKNFIGKADK